MLRVGTRGIDVQDARLWLGNLDSNQDKQSQSLLCYRYTIPQHNCLAKSMLYDSALEFWQDASRGQANQPGACVATLYLQATHLASMRDALLPRLCQPPSRPFSGIILPANRFVQPRAARGVQRRGMLCNVHSLARLSRCEMQAEPVRFRVHSRGTLSSTNGLALATHLAQRVNLPRPIHHAMLRPTKRPFVLRNMRSLSMKPTTGRQEAEQNKQEIIVREYVSEAIR